MSEQSTLRIGVLGAGAFSTFAARAFTKIKGVSIVAVTDQNAATAEHLATSVDAIILPDFETMLRDERVDLVYIGTPPFLHYDQSKQALQAGKHVICEKPAALRTSEAEELAEYARSRNLLYVVNLMQRYNPLYAFVQTIIEEHWLGDFLHGYFENYARDTQLTPDHWFWNREKSGGIFIEHGVHFFDMFSGWFGEGKLLHSLQLDRAGVQPPITDRVHASVKYGDAVVNFYHGFNQPAQLDRQELRLLFDYGDITLYEWVPVKIRLYGLLKMSRIVQFMHKMPGSVVLYHSTPDIDMHPDAGIKAEEAAQQMSRSDKTKLVARGKFRDIPFDAWATLEAGDPADKMQQYEQLVISMLKDQWEWIKDPQHRRVIDERNAVESLRIAEAATNFK